MKKKKAFSQKTIVIVEEMEAAEKEIANLPEDHEFTQEQLADLEDVRHAALKLANMVEATLADFEGRRPKLCP